MGTEDPNALGSVEFEVFGQVQGCYFTKFCREVAETLGIAGWVKNSKKGTIVGKLQGNKPQLDQIKNINDLDLYMEIIHGPYILEPKTKVPTRKKIDWLSTTGSPGCKIEKCELTNWQHLLRLDYKDFTVRF